MSGDMVDEYIRMGELMSLECLEQFASGVVELFKDEFLRPPNQEETKILLRRRDVLVFPEILESIYFSQWSWKNCSTAYHRQFNGKKKLSAVTIETIADDGYYIWHAILVINGCNDDLSVLDASPLTLMI